MRSPGTRRKSSTTTDLQTWSSHQTGCYEETEVLEQEGVSEAIVAFDPVTLQRRLHFGRGVFRKGIYGLAFVGDELYFGKDRLRDVEEAIAAAG